jgi:hypothetical protein
MVRLPPARMQVPAAEASVQVQQQPLPPSCAPALNHPVPLIQADTRCFARATLG